MICRKSRGVKGDVDLFRWAKDRKDQLHRRRCRYFGPPRVELELVIVVDFSIVYYWYRELKHSNILERVHPRGQTHP